MTERQEAIQNCLNIYSSPAYQVHIDELNTLYNATLKWLLKDGRDKYDENSGILKGIKKCMGIRNKLMLEYKRAKEEAEG